jgi:hypothetical protein
VSKNIHELAVSCHNAKKRVKMQRPTLPNNQPEKHPNIGGSVFSGARILVLVKLNISAEDTNFFLPFQI